MFEHFVKHVCERCGTAFRGAGVFFVRPRDQRRLRLCGSKCLAEERAAIEKALAARREAKRRRRQEYKRSFLDAVARGEVTRLAADFGQPERGDAVGVVGGLPRGIRREQWPRGEDGPWLHMATLDLRRLPQPNARELGVALFLETIRQSDESGTHWTPGGSVQLVAVETLEVDSSVSEMDRTGYPVDLIDPAALLGYPAAAGFSPLGSSSSFVGGRPSTFEGDPLQDRIPEIATAAFVAQLDGGLFRDADVLGLHELAALYVFEHEALIDTFS
jgi:hypothetical protein